ncbi:MAG TPA: methionine--tRNA ligase [Firmicutes bacterium]|nr:methionine--tRNA ligase [Bacillota bacterium]
MKTFYITTPIYYPNDKLHIGHAYTTVAADAIARFKKLQGYDVFFLTGTDEHGQKIQRRAAKAGKDPKKFVDEIVAGIKQLWSKLGVDYSYFIRTTDEHHERAVQHIFKKIQEKGDIYKATYEGWYCVPCETFWLERQLVDGKCPDCGAPVELLSEESYFFRISKYADRLLKYIEDNPDFIQPVSRRNEMVSFIKSGLEDLCISRTTFDWGIKVPGDPKHVIYVWFDALSNYITALGYPDNTENFQKYWPADVHLVGKEIVRFHTIIWPIILMALDLPLPRKVFGHGWLVLESGKMSKSKGNVIDPIELVNKYGLDAVRYFLLREIPFGSDGMYSEEALVNRINFDLANDLGNLLHRTLTMVRRFAGGKIPAPGREQPEDKRLRLLAAETAEKVAAHMERLEISDAIAAAFSLVAAGNKYVDEMAPWSIAKTGPQERLNTVLYYLCEVLRQCSVMLSPFMIETPGKIMAQLGIGASYLAGTWSELTKWGLTPSGGEVQEPTPIFPRIEPESRSVTGSDAQAELITIEDFKKLELKVAKILEAEKVKGADKLLKLEIDLGGERRQIVSGIAKHYSPEELIGKNIVVLANLQPARIRGVESCGMLLAASSGEKLALVTTDGDIEPGSRIS